MSSVPSGRPPVRPWGTLLAPRRRASRSRRPRLQPIPPGSMTSSTPRPIPCCGDPRQRVARVAASASRPTSRGSRPGRSRPLSSPGWTRAGRSRCSEPPPGPARRITQVQRARFTSSSRSTARPATPGASSSSPTTRRASDAVQTPAPRGDPPLTGMPPDLARYDGAWVTPHIEPIQGSSAGRRSWPRSTPDFGYQGTPEGVPGQVEACTTPSRGRDPYVNSTIDLVPARGWSPSGPDCPASLNHNANCIDGTVLFASLLESASLQQGSCSSPATPSWPGRIARQRRVGLPRDHDDRHPRLRRGQRPRPRSVPAVVRSLQC